MTYPVRFNRQPLKNGVKEGKRSRRAFIVKCQVL